MSRSFSGRRSAVAAMALFAGLCAAGDASADPWSLPIASSPPPAPVAPPPGPAFFALKTLKDQVGVATFTAPDWHPGVVRHVILMRFKPGVGLLQRDEVLQRYVRLVQDSRRPDGRRVIVSIDGGWQNSGEPTTQGYELGFVVTFASEGDRNFFIGRPVVTEPGFFDPAHMAFRAFALPLLASVQAFDYAVAASETAKAPPARRRH